VNRDDDPYRSFEADYEQKARSGLCNAGLDWPAVRSLCPTPLRGSRVLDAACGPGEHAAWACKRGARVDAFDRNGEFVARAAERIGDRGTAFEHDLAAPLDVEAGVYDLVLCGLALHYVEDWTVPLSGFARALRPGGVLVLSTHHPASTWQLFQLADYHRTQEVRDQWTVGGRPMAVRHWHRSLESILASLGAAGFRLERLLEPRPDPAWMEREPALAAKIQRCPWFLALRCRLEG
jgi:SAM-dependent methyltransferase